MTRLFKLGLVSLPLLLMLSCNGGRIKPPDNYTELFDAEGKMEKTSAPVHQGTRVIPFDSIPKGVKEFGTRVSGNPVNIDVASVLKVKSKVTLSQIASSVRYRFITLPDTLHGKVGGTVLNARSPRCYVSNGYGLFFTNEEGVVCDTLFKNEIEIGFHKGNPYYTNVGSIVSGLGLHDDWLVYSTVNREEQKTLQYITNASTREVSCVVDKKGLHSRSISIPFSNGEWAELFTRDLNASSNLLAFFGRNADTLSLFTSSVLAPDIKLQSYANPESDYAYWLNDELYIKQAYNDTVFKLKGRNILQPVYVLNMGEWKASVEQCFRGNAEGKILVDSWVETSKGAFIALTKGRDYPNARRDGLVKFVYAFYLKAGNRMFSLDIPETTVPDDVFIPNDIDGGCPINFSNLTSDDGSYNQVYSYTRLKRWVESSGFSSLPKSNQDFLLDILSKLKPYQLFVVSVQ